MHNILHALLDDGLLNEECIQDYMKGLCLSLHEHNEREEGDVAVIGMEPRCQDL
jgi:hypothetical protein